MTKREEWSVITRSKLAKLYKRHAAPAIAAMYDVTSGAVYHRLYTFGLTAKQTGCKRSHGPKSRFKPPKEELAKLYETMSMRDIAVHYGVGETVVFKRIKEYGLPFISRSKRLTGRPKTLEHRLAMSRAKVGKRLGAESGNWRGGITRLNLRARSRTAYREWKAAVFAKANYRCESCGIEHGVICKHCAHRVLLHAHHIKLFADNEKLRYDVKNGKALCERCHQSEHYRKSGELSGNP